MAYGSRHSAVSDAYLIATRLLANAPEDAVSGFENFRAASWRKRADVPAIEHPVGRYGMWLNLDEFASLLEKRAA